MIETIWLVGSEVCRIQEERCKCIFYMFIRDSTVPRPKGTWGPGWKWEEAWSPTTKTCNTLSRCLRLQHSTDWVLCPFLKQHFVKEMNVVPQFLWFGRNTLVFFICISYPLWLFFLNWALGPQGLECRNELLSFAFSWGVGATGNVIMLKCIKWRRGAPCWTADDSYVTGRIPHWSRHIHNHCIFLTLIKKTNYFDGVLVL